MLASLHGYDAVVRVLLAHCSADINQTELKGRVHSINGDLVHNATALWCALDRAHYVVAKSLLDLGKANVNNGPCHPLLIDAIIRERFDIVCFLVENSYADVNETVTNNQSKCSSLMVAAAKGNTQIMTYLIEKGAKLDYRTCIHENTPLAVAVIEGHLAPVLEQRTVSNTDRRAIIQWVQTLCRQQRTTPKGQTILHLCVDSGTSHNINYRLADIRPLIVFPNLSTTRLLLTYGKQWIDLDAINTIGCDTALHVISRCSKRDTNTNPVAIVELLINAGAHVDCVNQYGETPLSVAIRNEIKDFLRLKQIPSSLKCLCARLIAKHQLAYECLWPTQTPLNTFVLLHGGLGREHSCSESDSVSEID
ncbi:unnamed protein product [Rotaria sp. Silwood1]|nr:unnamed protein product [Rotaria sp. Silwood1]